MAQRGRPTNAERERRAQQAAQQAGEAAQAVESMPTELPVETTSAPEPQAQEERSEITLRPPRNEPRRQAMEEIRARDIQTKKGLGVELGLTDEETPKVPENQEVPQDPSPPTAESMLKGGKFSPGATKQVVDGQEYEVSQQEIDDAGGPRSWRIQKASENRLQEAKNALAEAKKLQEQQTPKQTQSPNDWLKSKIEALRWGTPEESAQALTEIMERQNKPVDQQQLVQAATDQMRHDDAVKNFDKEFADIGTSQLHLKLVVALRNERLQKGHPGDWNQFYRSLGNEVRAVMPKQSQPSLTPKSSDTPSQSSDKEERKSSIVNLPQASQRAALPEEPKPQTREDLINKMRKARGLPIA